ncbi:MAG: hypothetical protein ACI9VS_002069 [Candidatus Binatia bacterium]|jgi:hypothetical protein
MTAHRKMPSLVAELRAQFAESAKQLLSPWERLGEGCWPQASIAINANMRGLGFE